MGEAKRRKKLDPSYGKGSSRREVFLVDGDFDPVNSLQINTKASTRFGQVQVSLGKIFDLADAPAISEMVVSEKSIKTDRWYSPAVVKSGQDSMQGIVFYAPPYSDMKIGIAWFNSSWDAHVVRAIDADIRDAIAALARVRFAANPCRFESTKGFGV